MKRVFVLILACFCLHLYADDYKILQMNTSTIRIGNVLCKQGDTFSDNEKIGWSNEKQAIKTMNLRTKQIKLFVAKAFSNVKAKSVKEYYIKNNHLSTRGGIMSFSDLAEELSDTIYIYGTIPIESPIELDTLSSYHISYYDGEQVKWCTLMSNDYKFFLSRELFEDASNEELIISLYFRRKGIEDYLISDNLHVIVLPQEIEE